MRRSAAVEMPRIPQWISEKCVPYKTFKMAVVSGVPKYRCRAAMSAVLLFGFVVQRIAQPGKPLTVDNSSERIRAFFETTAPRGLPVVFPLSLTFLELEYYSSPSLASNLYYL